MNDDLDLVVLQAEEEVRLDQLESFVRERRRVDRDLRPHAPGWVRKRLLRRGALELIASPAAKVTPGSGQHDGADGFARAAPDALERGRLPAADRHDPPTVVPLCVHG